MIREDLLELTRIRRDLSRPDRVPAWSEALEALWDRLLPWRREHPGVESEWEARPMRIKRLRHPSGDPKRERVVVWPTAGDCRAAEQIIMGLLDDAGILVKRRTVSGPRRPEVPQEAQERGQEPRGEPDPLLGAL